MSDKHEEISSRDLLKRPLRRFAARLAFLALAASAPIVIGETAHEPRADAAASASAEAKPHFDRRHFDLYASLGATALDRVLAKLDHSTLSVGGARPIDIRMGIVSAAFRPGYPVVEVPATARDRTTGAETEIMVEAKLLIKQVPGAAAGAALHAVPVRIVPTRQWGLHNLARWDFARRLRELEAVDLPQAPVLPIKAASEERVEEEESGPVGLLAPAYAASAPIAGAYPIA